MHQVSLDEAKTQSSDLIEAALKGEAVSIITDDQKAVQLVPVTIPGQRRQAGSAKGLVQMTDDFDAPLEDFKEYMKGDCCSIPTASSGLSRTVPA
jgi:antitoxin (DNA-binding transcriptional repressor) of toxin-antitoxin stability system